MLVHGFTATPDEVRSLGDALSAAGFHCHAVRLPGRRYDCGSKIGYLQATLEYGLRHPETGEEFARYLRSRKD